jgi:hypothetical protein
VMRAGDDFVGTLPADVSVTWREHRAALGSLTWDQALTLHRARTPVCVGWVRRTGDRELSP